MSFSISDSSAIPARGKRTVSERAIENGDPLVLRKKAHEVAKHGPSVSTTSEAAVAATKKATQV